LFGSDTIDVLLKPSRSVKALLLLSLMMAGVIISMAVAALWDMRQRELAHARTEITGLSRILSDQTTRTFEGVALTVRGIRDRLTDRIGNTLDLDSVPIHLLLQARAAGLPQVKAIFLVNAQGEVVNSSRADFKPGATAVDRDYFRHFADGGTDDLFIGQPVTSRIDGHPVYFASTRLLDASGRMRGVLVASIRIDFFESLYQGVGPEMAGRILLLNQRGVLLAGTNHGDLAYGSSVGAVNDLQRLQGQTGDDALSTEETSPSGHWFVAYRRVAKFPLVISAAIDEDHALASWRRIVCPISGALLLILAMLAGTTFMIARNLTRKDSLEAAVREGDGQIRYMVQSARDAIVTVDTGHRITLFNRAAETMFGLKAADAIGRPLEEVLSSNLSEEHAAQVLRHVQQGWLSTATPVLAGTIELRRDGRDFPVELSQSTTIYRGKALLTAVFRDLTERRRAELQLFESNRQLQQLSASLQNVREEERVRIARELHDELGQLLTGIRMEVSWVGSRLAPDQAKLAGKVQDIKRQIDQTIASIRRISSDLRPSVLDDLGFAAAAAWYVEQFSARTGLDVQLSLSPDDPEQGGQVATTLFRVLQESLTNVVRHADATLVDVALRLDGGMWLLTIKDNGVGFDQQAELHKGFGIVGMRERVQILNGRFAVTSVPGGGTMIEIALQAENSLEVCSEEV